MDNKYNKAYNTYMKFIKRFWLWWEPYAQQALPIALNPKLR